MTAAMTWITGSLIHLLEEVGGFFIFCRSIARSLLTETGHFRPIMTQIAYVSYRSLPTILFAGFFVGAILVIEFNTILKEYDAQALIGGLNTSATIREVGPLIISFLLAGKIGAFTAAELGTMRVTEQIDAIRCLGARPLSYLVVPRFVAIVISSAVLLGAGLIVSVAGSIWIAGSLYGINPLLYASSIPRFVDSSAIFGGMIKSVVYGFIVAGVSCYKGYTAHGGARGVGRAVTETAVFINFYIVLANYALNSGFSWLQRMSE